jgi:hypothetical protein
MGYLLQNLHHPAVSPRASGFLFDRLAILELPVIMQNLVSLK